MKTEAASAASLQKGSMKYENVKNGIFISRPNRFIAEVEIDGEIKICHVKNTGRCKELLIPGVKVILEHSNNPTRRTEYDLIAVYKDKMLINVDSQAPNKVFGEWITRSGFFKNVTFVKPEYTYGKSRFDFYIEAKSKKILAEIKGVTLENDGILLFPDAPTERGVKHIRELIEAKANGFDSFIFFIIQMKNCKYFAPNRETHKEFADSLAEAYSKGVGVYALTCNVTEDSIEINDFAPINLNAY